MPNLTRLTVDLARKHLGLTPIDAEERRVMEHIEQRRPISQDAGELAEREDTFWDRLADGVARVGGSWPFIATFLLFLVVWTAINGYFLTSQQAFDPYPYIFLNLILSMLAALQAPVIMMSQNRQAEKDRIAAAHDYEVNLRSEIEILGMQQKLDRLRGEQHEKILTQQDEILRQLKAIDSRLKSASSE
ncbi:DUF1003 domain-containing protein [Qipengyuania zhejiangensis]|uniref:DUF1003 domain-containing protein n=1 Tax=Qipengyuania zhejiangensis TaxID=3077782 RepID=UPI002D76D9D1|nr:DUF1003 domain-containing protein [Qipengyuania sp. Z2]